LVVVQTIARPEVLTSFARPVGLSRSIPKSDWSMWMT